MSTRLVLEEDWESLLADNAELREKEEEADAIIVEWSRRFGECKTERDRLREFFEASVACEADDADDETFDRLYRARAALDKAEET